MAQAKNTNRKKASKQNQIKIMAYGDKTRWNEEKQLNITILASKENHFWNYQRNRFIAIDFKIHYCLKLCNLLAIPFNVVHLSIISMAPILNPFTKRKISTFIHGQRDNKSFIHSITFFTCILVLYAIDWCAFCFCVAVHCLWFMV